jgi:osomolarity two-component system, sensor histidine kinase CHK1
MYANLKAWRSVISSYRLTLVLYLENSYVTQAFPQKRLEVLRLLCAQAAVTIEKAQMYRSMEEAKQAAEAATLMKSTCKSG